MAILNTEESQVILEKYRGFFNQALHLEVEKIMGGSNILEEKHIDLFEEILNQNYNYISNVQDLSFEEKRELLWMDLFECIQVILDEHQNEDLTFDIELGAIYPEVATVLTPLVFDDLFYYSRQLKDYRQNKPNCKCPKDVVQEIKADYEKNRNHYLKLGLSKLKADTEQNQKGGKLTYGNYFRNV